MGRFFLKIMIKIAKFSYNFGVKNVTNNKDKQTEKKQFFGHFCGFGQEYQKNSFFQFYLWF